MNEKILVTGASGLVGSRFVELYSKGFNLVTPDINELDIASKDSVLGVIKKIKPSIIIHFAAYTDVSKAEEQRGDRRGACWNINVSGTQNLVESINPNLVHFIYISTDMVFPGSADNKGPYSEDHPIETDINKLTWYGFTKAEGERQVRKYLGNNATILRIICPVRAHFDAKLDYLRKPLKLYDEGKLYPLFTDQQISISFIDEICKALEIIISKEVFGTFHASSNNTTTPFEVISYLLEKTRGVKNIAKKGRVTDFLRYPKYGGLNVEYTEKILGIKFSSWKEIVDQLISQSLGRIS